MPRENDDACLEASVARIERRPYVPFLAEATRPRCSCEGYPDRPGRASGKEGES